MLATIEVSYSLLLSLDVTVCSLTQRENVYWKPFFSHFWWFDTSVYVWITSFLLHTEAITTAIVLATNSVNIFRAAGQSMKCMAFLYCLGNLYILICIRGRKCLCIHYVVYLLPFPPKPTLLCGFLFLFRFVFNSYTFFDWGWFLWTSRKMFLICSQLWEHFSSKILSPNWFGSSPHLPPPSFVKSILF